MWDVRRALARPTAHDAVMRVRTSTGVRPTDFYGHLFMSNTTDVELAAIGNHPRPRTRPVLTPLGTQMFICFELS